ATGGTPPYLYTWSGLPTGCTSINGARLACTPGAAGSYAVVVRVVDAAGFAVNATVAWEVAGTGGGMLTVDTSTLLLIVGVTVVVLAIVAAVVWRRRLRPPAGRRPTGPAV
ncbi:MAG: hypothetical protein L3K06_03655, partial [Thermoplasmata archaeon]|nr:hypothetical protein [Thermoplasmata archaeon]